MPVELVGCLPNAMKLKTCCNSWEQRVHKALPAVPAACVRSSRGARGRTLCYRCESRSATHLAFPSNPPVPGWSRRTGLPPTGGNKHENGTAAFVVPTSQKRCNQLHAKVEDGDAAPASQKTRCNDPLKGTEVDEAEDLNQHSGQCNAQPSPNFHQAWWKVSSLRGQRRFG